MSQREILDQLSNHFSIDSLTAFLRSASQDFKPQSADLAHYLADIEHISELQQMGFIEFSEESRMICAAARLESELSSRTGKLAQFNLAKKIIKENQYDGGLFIFHDDSGRFRLSLVVAQYQGTRLEFTNYRRYTYFVEPGLPNKTFITQLEKAQFTSFDKLLEAFSIEAVSDQFYGEFDPHFRALAAAVRGSEDQNLKEDFALLLVIRVIFLGFVQKKRWLGDDPNFLCNFLAEYRAGFEGQDLFYRDWLTPLFFDALNHAPGFNAYAGAPFPTRTKEILQMSPYLNGELFKRKHEVDDMGLGLPDQPIIDFMDFLFQYNFTVEENRLYDEELELNPEFLGLIFERLVNKQYGAVYTPRTEVDLMCRLGLLKWLEQNLQPPISSENLYNFMFRNMGVGDIYDEYQKQGDFSAAEIRQLLGLLEKVTVCDPAAGSGAFEVGMLQVLAELIASLYHRPQTPDEIKALQPSEYELKKAIIDRSLYGVEVQRWAVWINHLRLWLTLFVDMPNEFKDSPQPLLPSLTFKVRTGDSLVQRVGTRDFPVSGLTGLTQPQRTRLNELRKMKRDFFYNQREDAGAILKEEEKLFTGILNDQIDALEKEKQRLLQPQPRQDSFLSDTRTAQKELGEQAAVQRQREALELKITDLKNQRAMLKQSRPFLWSLEFSEVFLDRGGFDLIIGNPPYLRQEAIVDPVKARGLTPAQYKQALKEMLLLDYPEYFAKSRSVTHEFKPGRQPDGRSDLYTYFYVRSLRLLNENGIHIFICSNSWLDVGYGAWLQEFLLRTTPVHFIIDNHAKRSFTSSDVNTIISIMGAPDARGFNQDFVYRFLAFKRPFEEVVFAENLLEMQNTTSILKKDQFRIYPISAANLLREGGEPQPDGGIVYQGHKWGGIYLRAPDIYFTILQKGAGKFVRLGDVAEVRRGVTTGANDFFYLRPLGPGSRPGLLHVQNGAGWEGELEEEFLKPVIKSPRECRTIKIDPSKLEFLLFMCHKSKSDLKGTKALEYIQWGENSEFNKRSSTRLRTKWWDLGKRNPAPILVSSKIGERFIAYSNESELLEDKILYGVFPKELKNTIIMIALLNSQITRLLIEVTSRQLTGAQTIADVDVKVWENVLIPNPSIITGDIEEILLQNLGELSQREIQGVFSELGFGKCKIHNCKNPDHPYETINPDIFNSFEGLTQVSLDRLILDLSICDSIQLSKDDLKEILIAVTSIIKHKSIKSMSV